MRTGAEASQELGDDGLRGVGVLCVGREIPGGEAHGPPLGFHDVGVVGDVEVPGEHPLMVRTRVSREVVRHGYDRTLQGRTIVRSC